MPRLVSRRTLFTVLAVVCLAVGAALVAVLAWLPWNPLEGDVARLSSLLPDGLRVIVRIDAAQAARSPQAAWLWEHPSVRGLRQRLDLDRTIVEPVRDTEARLADATFGLGPAPTVRSDLLGREVVVALRGADALLLTRISARARALEAVRRLEPAELARLGLRLDGDLVLVEGAGRPPLVLARHRDVLVIGTTRQLVEDVLVRARDGGSRPAAVREFAAARRTAPEALAVFWADPAAAPAAAGVPEAGAIDSAEDFWLAVLDPARQRPLTGVVELRGGAGVRLRVAGGYRGEAPAALRRLADGCGTLDPAALAAVYALPGETIVAGGFRVPAARAVELFVEAQPPSRRELVTELLADGGETPTTVAARLARTLDDGVGAVVARLPEADGLDLDSPLGGAVDAIPATVLVFALRPGATGAEFLADLRRESELLFGSPLRAQPETLGGARLYTLERNSFGGNLALLRPAFALVPGRVVFSTHDGYLRRALVRATPQGPGSDRAPSDRALSDRACAVRVFGGPLRAYLDDQRWKHAERATYHDWRRERVQIRRELDRSGTRLSPEQRAETEERRILERVRRRDEVEFPRAIEEYRRAWQPLEILGEARLSAHFDGALYRLEAELDLIRP